MLVLGRGFVLKEGVFKDVFWSLVLTSRLKSLALSLALKVKSLTLALALIQYKVLVLSMKVTFVRVSELHWKLNGHVFLLLHYYSTGARTIYTTLILTKLICRWTKFAACLCTTNFVPYWSAFLAPQLRLSQWNAFSPRVDKWWCAHIVCAWATHCLKGNQSLYLLTLLVWTVDFNADWKLLVMVRFCHNNRNDILLHITWSVLH